MPVTMRGLAFTANWAELIAISCASAQPVIIAGPEFEGIEQSDPNTNPQSVPADPDIAVGHDLIIQVVNRWMRMWAVDEGEDDWVAVRDADLSDFLEDDEEVKPATDPRVIFDPESERFVVSAYQRDEDATREIVVAISEPEADRSSRHRATSDPPSPLALADSFLPASSIRPRERSASSGPAARPPRP